MRLEKIRLHLVSAGCPKHNICSLYQPESKTCISGPYAYCGKYRSIVETEGQKPQMPFTRVENNRIMNK